MSRNENIRAVLFFALLLVVVAEMMIVLLAIVTTGIVNYLSVLALLDSGLTICLLGMLAFMRG